MGAAWGGRPALGPCSVSKILLKAARLQLSMGLQEVLETEQALGACLGWQAQPWGLVQFPKPPTTTLKAEAW